MLAAEKDRSSLAKWQVFLGTIAGAPSLHVTAETENEVEFELGEPNDMAKMIQQFSSHEQLRASVMHAMHLPDQVVEENKTPSAASKATAAVPIPTSKEMLRILFDPNYLSGLHIEADQFVDDKNTKVAVLQISASTQKRYDLIARRFSILQDALNDPAQLAAVIKKYLPRIDKEPDVDTRPEFGEKIIAIKTNPDGLSGVVKFNYGLLQQVMQADFQLWTEQAPVIAVQDTSQTQAKFTINKAHLLQYTYQAIPSGLIVEEQSDQSLRPVAWRPAALRLNTSCVFILAVDRSGSMEPTFEDFKARLNIAIDKMLEGLDEWKFHLITFNHEVVTTTFVSNTHSKQTIQNAISATQATGQTHLNGALYECIRLAIVELQHNPNVVIIAGTDGVQTKETNFTQESINSEALRLREVHSQFMVYTMGFGSKYNRDYFKTLANKGGFTHLHLNEPQQVEALYENIKSMKVPKILFEFMQDVHKRFLQVACGEVAVAKFTVSGKDKITQVGSDNKFEFATEPLPAQRNVNIDGKEMGHKNKEVKTPAKPSLVKDEEFNDLVKALGLTATAYSANSKEALIDALTGPNSKSNAASSKAKVFILSTSPKNPLATTCLQVMALNSAGRGHINNLNCNPEIARKLRALNWGEIVAQTMKPDESVQGRAT